MWTVVVCGALFLLSFQTTTTVTKQSFIDSCIEDEMQGGINNPKTKAIIKDFCSCSADKMFDKYSAEEIDKIMKEGDDALTEAMMPLIQPCLDDLQEKMSKIEDSGDDSTDSK